MLVPDGAVTPGMLAAGFGVAWILGLVVLELLEATRTFFSVVLALLDEKWDRRRARKAGRAIEAANWVGQVAY